VQLVAINSQSADYFSAALRLFFRKNKDKYRGYRLKKDTENTNYLAVNI
jgi:hypothetical protein